MRPLSGLRVGPFYGCYVVRPKERLGYDEYPERDLYLEKVIEASAARWSSTTEPASAAASR